MSPTRRRFLGWLVLAAAAGAGAAWTGRHALKRWLMVAPLGAGRPGPLPPSTAGVLEAAVRTLLEDRVEVSHYLETFRWRAEHRRGARALYQRFEFAVDEASRRAGHPGFRRAPPAARARVLARLLPARGLRRVGRLLLARDDERYARHVVREVFRRFARTDAWVLAGYGAWPGMPRALAPPEPPEPRT